MRVEITKQEAEQLISWPGLVHLMVSAEAQGPQGATANLMSGALLIVGKINEQEIFHIDGSAEQLKETSEFKGGIQSIDDALSGSL